MAKTSDASLPLLTNPRLVEIDRQFLGPIIKYPFCPIVMIGVAPLKQPQ